MTPFLKILPNSHTAHAPHHVHPLQTVPAQFKKCYLLFLKWVTLIFFALFLILCCFLVVWAAELIDFGIKLFFCILPQVISHLSTNVLQLGFLSEIGQGHQPSPY